MRRNESTGFPHLESEHKQSLLDNMKYRIRHLVEYAALRTAAALLNLLPYRAALAVGWLLAWPAFHVFRFRVGTAKSRIREVFEGRFAEREVSEIAWISFRNMFFSGVEMVRVSRMNLAWLLSVSDCRHMMETIKKHCDTARGAILAVPHMGNWEMGGVTAHLYGIPIFNIAAVQRNPLVNAYMNQLRAGPGTETIERGSGAIRTVIQKLRHGGCLAILPDVRIRSGGISVPFLGKRANLGKGMGLFSRHAAVPVFPCIVTRQGWCRHKIEIFDPIVPDRTLDRDKDVLRITTLVMRIIEEAVRGDPAQWFWFNKRWVLDPPEKESPQRVEEESGMD